MLRNPIFPLDDCLTRPVEPYESGVPPGSIDLRLLLRLPVWDHAVLNIEGIYQVFPNIKVKVEDCLTFLRACRLLVPGLAFEGYCD